MNLKVLYRKNVVTATVTFSAARVARLMADKCVGVVVVVDGKKHPIGIVTDRDLMKLVVAGSRDAEKVQAGDIMQRPVVVLRVDDDPERALEVLRDHAIRRAPVVDRFGALSGIISIDDLVRHLVGQLADAAEVFRTTVESKALVKV